MKPAILIGCESKYKALRGTWAFVCIHLSLYLHFVGTGLTGAFEELQNETANP